MTIAEIWELSRTNQYTWILPCVLFAGAIAILLSSIIKNNIARRIVKLVFVLVFTYVALEASSMAIREKWRIRHEWGRQNEASLTDRERGALTADGANLTMGPLIYGGGYSLLIFGVALIVSSIIVKMISRKDSQQGIEAYISAKETNLKCQ